DEFNRPLHLLDHLLPADRGAVSDLQKQTSSGRTLASLIPKDEVHWAGGKADVLAVKQTLTARAGTTTLASFKDNSAALVRGPAGAGTIYCAGFLPSLSYIKPALDARNALKKKVDDGGPLSAAEQKEATLLERSANPWKFPADVRDLILTPARAANIAPPITCSVPLVDAVYMPHEKGILIPLANYTVEPISLLTLTVNVPHRVARAESVAHGNIPFKQISPTSISLSLPLENNDFVKLYFE